MNYYQNKYSNIKLFGTKYKLFLPPYQITFFTAFGQAKIFFSYHILMNILIYILFCDKKKSLNNIPYRKTFQNKKGTCLNKQNVVLKRFYNIFSTTRIWYLITSWVFTGSKKKKKKKHFADVLQRICRWKFCKIHRKTPVLESLFNKIAVIKTVHHKCFHMKCFL